VHTLVFRVRDAEPPPLSELCSGRIGRRRIIFSNDVSDLTSKIGIGSAALNTPRIGAATNAESVEAESTRKSMR
jgi:hypothetical protein